MIQTEFRAPRAESTRRWHGLTKDKSVDFFNETHLGIINAKTSFEGGSGPVSERVLSARYLFVTVGYESTQQPSCLAIGGYQGEVGGQFGFVSSR